MKRLTDTPRSSRDVPSTAPVLPPLGALEILAAGQETFLFLDADFRVRYANPATERLFGRSVESLYGRRPWEGWPSAIGAGAEQHYRRALTEGSHVTFRDQADRSTAPVHLEVNAYPAAGGLAVFIRDISAQQQLLEDARQAALAIWQDQLELENRNRDLVRENVRRSDAERDSVTARASEARYRALVEAATQMVWSTDANGQVADIPFWRELTGQTVEEVRGSGWLDAIHPADAPGTLQRFRDAVASRRPYEAQYRLRLRDGSYRWYRARGVPVLAPDGSVREWVGLFNEVDRMIRRDEGMQFLVDASAALAETLEEETTLDTLARLAVDQLADGAMITLVREGGRLEHVTTRSRDGHTAALAAETERMYPLPSDASSGYPRAIRTGEAELIPPDAFHEDILPKVAADAIHLERLRRLAMYSGMVVPLVARGHIMGAMTLVLHGPERRRPFDAADLAVAIELGRRAALALDNGRLYAAERDARDEAERASHAKSDLLAKVSHETRQPVHATIGWVNTIEMELHGAVTEAQAEALGRIRQNQLRLLAVLNDLLDISRIEAGRLDLHLRVLEVAEVVDVVESAVSPQMRDQNLVLAFPRPARDVVVRADTDQLVGILTNLLGNAAKFTPPGGRVEVRCERHDGWVRIHVTDTGIGIVPALHQRVFEPFFQVESGLTRTITGTGLGLSISRESARAMGGDITLESAPGSGSTFTVMLPAG